MDIRVILLCIVTVYGGEQNRYYRTQIGGQLDSSVDNANDYVGFDQPLYFKWLARQFLEQAESRRDPTKIKLIPFTAKDALLHDPVDFESAFHGDGSKDDAGKIQGDQTHKALEEFGEDDVYVSRRTFRHSPKPPKGKTYGKSSYPQKKGSKRRTDPSAMEYYTSLYSKHKDVEMILPKEKAIILPMVNGKPKPYQGYRAEPDAMPYGSDQSDIVYGKPKRGVHSIPSYRMKRSPAEYHGGIYPHFDYSDPENADRVAKNEKAMHKKAGKEYPKKHRSKSSDKPYNYHKYPKGNRKTHKRSSDESEDQAEDEEEQAEDNDYKVPPYKYKYDSSFVIPQLEIKYYPYEKKPEVKRDDSEDEGTEDGETYESQIDEYTAGYEKYKKSLPTDLESYFGKPDFGDYSGEATENLEENKNCEKVTKQDQAAENATEQANSKGTEVCYICRNPKTGGTYEQCAYQTEPKSEKYFYGGSTSFKSDESPKPVNYRYRRSTFGTEFDLDKFIFGGDSDLKRKVRQNMEHSLFDRPRKDHEKRYSRNWHPDKEGYGRGSYRKHDHHGSPSSKKSKKSKNKEEPPQSYNGPKYTYEGPKHTYEGPSEPYEGPIHRDYYITSDDRLEDDENSQSNEETQPKPKKEFYEYNTYHPDRRYSQSSTRGKYAPEPRRGSDEEDGAFGPESSYTADYRFGPEHFVDDEEEERPKEKQRSESKQKPVERRPKHSESESRPAPSTDAEEKDVGNVKVFKNGDVCRKKKVDGMICMVCKNEKTAATYEQCQYSSKPKDKYYAFGSQKSYRTSDPHGPRDGEAEEDGDQYPEKSDIVEKKIMITKQSKVFQDDSGPLESLPAIPSGIGDLLGSPSDHMEARLYDPNGNDTDNRQVSESVMRMEPRDGIEGLEEYLYSDSEDSEKKATDEDREYKSYDDYFHDIFPEFSNRKESSPYSEESKESDEDDEEESEESESERHTNFDPFSNIRKFKGDTPSFLEEYTGDEEEEGGRSAEATNEEPLRLKDKKSRVSPDYFTEESHEYHKKDIEKALGEFQSRDWSNCKKIVKNKLTCYQCVDKNGVNNEECMYVEASQPIKEHMEYHEKKELKPEKLDLKKEKEPLTESTPTEEPTTEAPKVYRRMRRPKNAKEVHEEVAMQAEEVASKRRPIGDFAGVPRVPEEDVMTPVPSITTEAVVEDTTEKPQTRVIKRNQKRIKTSKKLVETTTPRIRKRKHPVKKFTEDGGEATEQVPIAKMENVTAPVSEPTIK